MKTTLNLDGEKIGTLKSVEIKQPRRPELEITPTDDGIKVSVTNFEQGDVWDLYIGKAEGTYDLVAEGIDTKSVEIEKHTDDMLKMKAGFGGALGAPKHVR